MTAQEIFRDLVGYSVRSAGTEANSRVKVTPGMLGWADLIFCMEKKHVRRIKEKYGDIVAEKQVICLHIRDDYGYMDEQLIHMLKDHMSKILK